MNRQDTPGREYVQDYIGVDVMFIIDSFGYSIVLPDFLYGTGGDSSVYVQRTSLPEVLRWDSLSGTSIEGYKVHFAYGFILNFRREQIFQHLFFPDLQDRYAVGRPRHFTLLGSFSDRDHKLFMQNMLRGFLNGVQTLFDFCFWDNLPDGLENIQGIKYCKNLPQPAFSVFHSVEEIS